MEQHVLLTGMPGVGKTTLIKKLVGILKTKNFKCAGFYTEELRDKYDNRIGFDIVSLDNRRATLARLMKSNQHCIHSVGKYEVFVNEFESFVIPLIAGEQVCDILILDEIGKMELFSKQFQQHVDRLFKENKHIILSTIPVPKNRPIHFVEKLRSSTQCKVFSVDRSNRNQLLNEILAKIESIQKK